MHRLLPIGLVMCLMMMSCAVLAGKEDVADERRASLDLSFVESLRSQLSLRGESMREPQFATSPATNLQQPKSVYADAFAVYVTDLYLSTAIPSPRVFLFDRSERAVTVLPTPAVGKLLFPASIVVDSARTIYVADPQQGLVLGYDRNGTLLRVLGRTGELSRPTALAIDPSRGRLYIADAALRKVITFSEAGMYQRLDAHVDLETHVFRTVSDVFVDRENALYVLDGKGKQVTVYDHTGRLLRKFKVAGDGPQTPLEAAALAVDSDGHIYVCDSISNNILIFDQEGKFVQTWGRTGSLAGDFSTPADIFIDRSDLIYVADQMNGRVQVFQYRK